MTGSTSIVSPSLNRAADIQDYVDSVLAGNKQFFEDLGSDFTTYIENIAYEGFSPARLGKLYLSHPNRVSGTESDLAMMLALFLERGSKVSKMIKMSETGSNKVKELIKVYNLADSGKNVTATRFTLARLSLAFPLHSVVYTINYRKSGPLHNYNQHAALKVQAFSALIPQTNYGIYPPSVIESLTSAFLATQVELTKIINPNDPDPMGSAQFYNNLGITTSSLNDAERIKVLEEIGILIKRNKSLVASVIVP
nr:MAG: nucleocapsid protein [Hangzhou frankliniella intonsa phasmavirus 1]